MFGQFWALSVLETLLWSGWQHKSSLPVCDVPEGLVNSGTPYAVGAEFQISGDTCRNGLLNIVCEH